jgi:hypothetical protein
MSTVIAALMGDPAREGDHAYSTKHMGPGTNIKVRSTLRLLGRFQISKMEGLGKVSSIESLSLLVFSWSVRD